MNRRAAISRMLGAPLALAIAPVVMAGENMTPVRPRMLTDAEIARLYEVPVSMIRPRLHRYEPEEEIQEVMRWHSVDAS